MFPQTAKIGLMPSLQMDKITADHADIFRAVHAESASITSKRISV
jgi:hypothetical protein